MFYNQQQFYNPNQDILQVAAQSSGRAVLFLFQPLARPFSDQAHRPLTYGMNDDIFHAAHEAAHRANMGTAPRVAVESVVNRIDTLSSILPSNIPTARIGLSHLSDTWKFMLVINGEFLEPGQPAIFSRNNSGREIYFGYCVGEPINPLTLNMSSPTVNPEAHMVITHKTVIQTYAEHGPSASMGRFSTMSDTDMIDPHVITQLSSSPLQINDPLHLNQSADISSTGVGGQILAIPQPVSTNNLSVLPGPVAIDTRMHNPQDNLTALMSAAIVTNTKLTTDKQLNRDNPFVTDNMTRGDLLSESMENYFQTGTSTVNTVGLRPDTVHLLGQLCQRYRPEIFPYANDRTTSFAPHDQSYQRPHMVFCSLLCSAIPPLLMQAQILHFAFHYETNKSNLAQPDNWVIHAAASAVPMDNAVLNQKLNAIMHILRHGLFRMMLEGRGDFAVHGSFGAANVTHCYVNFRCDDERMVDPFEVPTIFGGLTSTLMADPNTTFQNTSQYSQLLNAMTGTELTENIPEMRNTAPIYSVSGAPAAPNQTPLILPGLVRF